MGDQLFCPLLPFPPLLRGALQNPSVSITLFAVQALFLLLSFYHHHGGRRQTRIEGGGRQSLSLGRRGESTLYSLFPRGRLLLLLLLPNWKAAVPPLTKTLKEAQGSLSTSAAMSVLHKGWGCSSACFLQTGGGGGGGGSF